MSTSQQIDAKGETGVYLIPEEALHLNRAEARVVRMMREVGRRGKSWMLVLIGNSAGVRVHETLPPRWEPK